MFAEVLPLQPRPGVDPCVITICLIACILHVSGVESTLVGGFTEDAPKPKATCILPGCAGALPTSWQSICLSGLV